MIFLAAVSEPTQRCTQLSSRICRCLTLFLSPAVPGLQARLTDSIDRRGSIEQCVLFYAALSKVLLLMPKGTRATSF